MHRYFGWAKAVIKLGLKGADKPYAASITRLGQIAAAAITVGFSLVIMAAHLRANES